MSPLINFLLENTVETDKEEEHKYKLAPGKNQPSVAIYLKHYTFEHKPLEEFNPFDGQLHLLWELVDYLGNVEDAWRWIGLCLDLEMMTFDQSTGEFTKTDKVYGKSDKRWADTN